MCVCVCLCVCVGVGGRGGGGSLWKIVNLSDGVGVPTAW